MRQHLMISAALIVAAAACATTDAEKVRDADDVEQESLPPIGRQHTRMTIDQLSNSIPVVLGDDVTWEVVVGGQTYQVFTVLSGTLGSPDYITITEEPAIPDALFVKFMTDMAKNTCTQAINGDALTRFEDVNENLHYLHLSFFGEYVASDEDLAGLRTIYDIAQSEGANGWYAVCIAMLSAPAFHIY